MKFFYVFAAFAVSFFTLQSNTFSQKISYSLSFPAPHTHYGKVLMQVNEAKGQEAVLLMPVWAPGSYLVREFAKNMENCLAKDLKGNLLPMKKLSKNEWQITLPADKSFTFEYDLYAFEMSVRTNFIDESHAYLNPVAAFPLLKGAENKAGLLRIEPFAAWKKISTALEKDNNADFLRKFNNYDELADSPIEIGNHEIFEFTSAGVPHTVAVYGEMPLFDAKQFFTEDFKKITETCTAIFGKNPCQSYTFIVHNLENGSGGLEHKNSTTLQVKRNAYLSESGRIGVLSLAAHEYFHLWNVKRLRPAGIGPFDYSKENYTSLLWFSEGITSYFDELLLYNAGFMSLETLLDGFFSKVNTAEKRPGNKVHSLADASFDAWIKFYRPNENSFNSTCSYYEKGALAGFLLDLEIARRTAGQKNLSGLMRLLYEEFFEKKDTGFTENDLLRVVNAYTQSDLSDFFALCINGTGQPDYEKLFEPAGIGVKKVNIRKKNWGAQLKDENGKIVIATLSRETLLYHAGLSVQDEIVAVNGFRLKSISEWLFWENNFKEGEKCKILFARDGRMSEKEIEVKFFEENHFIFDNRKNKTDAQKKVFEAVFKP
jgi:predicted metalloprotease with PDZ domain